MLDGEVAAGLQNVIETGDVRFHICVRMVDGIADTGLGRQIHDKRRMPGLKDTSDGVPVCQVSADENMTGRGVLGRFFNQGKAIFLQSRVIIIVHAVEADHGAAVKLFEQPEHQIGPDEAGRAGDKDGFPL